MDSVRRVLALMVLGLLTVPGLASRELLQASSSSSSSGSASACSSAKVYTYGGSGTAWSRSDAAVIQAAADKCATAIKYYYADTYTCGGRTQWSTVSIYTAAEACAAAVAKVMVSSASLSATKGIAGACAQGCASSNAYALAVAYAAKNAFKEASGYCTAVEAYVESKAFAAAFVDVMATAHTYACSKSRFGSSAYSYADASATIKAVATSIAKAYASVWSVACSSNCGRYGSCGSCSYTSIPADAMAESYAIIVDGKYAVAANIADASGKICGGGDIRTVVEDSVAAWLDLCLNAWYKLYSKAYATSGANACGWAYSEAHLLALAEAAVTTYTSAWAYNGYCANSYATLTSAVALPDGTMESYFGPSATYVAFKTAFVQAWNYACADGSSKYAVTGKTFVKPFLESNPGYATAMVAAYSTIKNDCACAGNPWCCTTCTWSSSCGGYKADIAV